MVGNIRRVGGPSSSGESRSVRKTTRGKVLNLPGDSEIEIFSRKGFSDLKDAMASQEDDDSAEEQLKNLMHQAAQNKKGTRLANMKAQLKD